MGLGDLGFTDWVYNPGSWIYVSARSVARLNLLKLILKVHDPIASIWGYHYGLLDPKDPY